MAIIKTVNPNEATGAVAEIYEHFKSKFGFVPNAFQVTSSSEFLLSQQVKFLGYYMQHPTINFHLQAFIRMLVSVTHHCEYCVNMNTGLLMQSGITFEQIAAAKENPNNAPLPEKDKAMLLFVLKVVHNSNNIESSDLEQLRSIGWQDSEILEATFHGTSQIGTDMIFNAFKVENDKM